MNNQNQNKCSLPSVARSAIALLLLVFISIYTNSNGQVFNTTTCPISTSCSSGGTNAGDPQTICQNETLHLNGLYNPALNGTAITWTNVSHCIGTTSGVGTITPTFVTTPSIALNASVTFTAPGVYMFLLSAECRTSIVSIVEGDTTFAALDDTVRITVLPIPNSNAGNDTLSCAHDAATYGSGSQWYAPLHASPAGLGETGAWSLLVPSYSGNIAAFGGLTELSNPNAVFRAGAYGGIHTLIWTVTNTATGCSNSDTVIVHLPGEVGPVWAASDTVCSNLFQMNANENYSSTGTTANYLPYLTAFAGPDPTFFTFYQTSGPSTATITNAGGGNVNITVSTVGYYEFTYWLHGLCVNDSASYSIYFETATPVTNPIYMPTYTVCDSTDTFRFVNVMPNLMAGESSQWFLSSGLTALGSTLNQDTIYVVWDGVTPLSQTVTYTIFSADTASGCDKSWTAGIARLYKPVIFSMQDTTLPCGASNMVFCYEPRDYISGGILYDNIITYYPLQLIQPVGASANLAAGYTTPPPYPTPNYLFHGTIQNMSLPGVYSVVIHFRDRCGNHVYDTINVTVDLPPSGSNAGNEIILLCGQNVTELQANIPVIGSGTWSSLDIPNGLIPTFYPTDADFIANFSSTSNPNPSVVGFDLTGWYYFNWTVCNPNCPAPTPSECWSNVVSVYAPDSTVNTAQAGNDTLLCDTAGFHIYTIGIQGLPGTWTQLSTNPDTVIISNIYTDAPFIHGFTTSGVYGFVWSVPSGCGNLSDTMYVTYQPENCCFAANNPVYLQWIGNISITQNTVMSGKYYIDGIITVSNNAILDITNVDLVFATCAGINFESGTTIRANNSVFRPCNIQESWRGLQFEDNTFGVIENSIFKSAQYAIDLREGVNTIRIFNNTFANNYVAINCYNNEIMEAITGNTFTIDNSFVDFYKGACALRDTFNLSFFNQTGYIANYGIIGNGSTFYGLISQNNFINGSDPEDNHLFYGIFGKKIFANIANNAFTNMFRAVDIGGSNGLSIFNNKIDVALIGKITINSLRYITQIRLTQSTFCKINNNTITSSIKSPRDRFTIFELGGLIYIEGNENTEIANNSFNGGFTQILGFKSADTYVNNNLLKESEYVGIYLDNCSTSDITCNQIFMKNSNDLSNYGVIINDIDVELQTSLSFIRNNCIFDADAAISIYSMDCNYRIPVIYNNFLYNFKTIGISVDGTGSIGTIGLPGRNTFISNNYNNGAVDVQNNPICNVSIAGNYGINAVGGSVNVINSLPYNSSASCANQITEFSQYTYNQNLEMSALTSCDAYSIRNESIIEIAQNVVRLAPTINQQINNWSSDEMLNKSEGLFNLLASFKKQTEINTLYNLVNSSGKLSGNNLAWVNYYYNFAKANYQTALNNLQGISYSNENEKNLIQLETIKTNMQIQNLAPSQLNQSVIAQLKTIAAAKVSCSAMAYDMLKLAIDGYDYPFQTVNLRAVEPSKNVKSLLASTINVWPNPASNQLQLELINASDANAVIVINNANGQVIYTQSTNLKAGKITLDISNFAKGIYHLQVLGVEDKNLVATFIKQ